ncbi:MAG: protein kinase [Thermoanaerobaculia bacterium]|nr:protein kinase [Thermoanaerobaculia bacterium]
MPLDEAVAIAAQIAEALEAAHERGVVHRDLKPGNVMIGPEGEVKVLDFGLAKALAPEVESGAGGLSMSPTLTAQMTGANVLLGTAGYMSPEQARGRPVDRRADIWAFGVLVYEMLRGEALFVGETISDTLAGVLKEEPSWRDLPHDLPPRLRWLLERCLDKEPSTRLRDIGEARVLLSGDLHGPPPGAGEEREGAFRRRPAGWTWMAAAVAAGLVAGVGIGVLALRSAPAERQAPPVRRYEIPIPGLFSFFGNHPVVSPDGEALAYCANRALWVRRLDEPEPHRLMELADDLWGLGWSPDGGSLAYSSGGTLWRLAVDGGDGPVPVTTVPDRGRGDAKGLLVVVSSYRSQTTPDRDGWPEIV